MSKRSSSWQGGREGCHPASPRSGGTRRRRGPHSATEIVVAAVEIADREGLEAVSIRRIAARLDGRPMSFYDHFENKEELLGAMADEAVGSVVGPLPDGWREALGTNARRIYAAMVRHPWVVAVFGRRPRFGPNSTAIARQTAAAVADLPFEAAEIWLAVGTINDYVVGHSLRIASAPRGRKLEDMVPEDMIAAEDLAATPELAALPDSLRTRDSIERFEAGLQTVLDGIERRYLK